MSKAGSRRKKVSFLACWWHQVHFHTSQVKLIEEDEVAELDCCAFFKNGNGSCYWPSSFRLCSLVCPLDCFLVNCIGGATTYFFLFAAALFFSGVVAKVGLQQLRQIYCFMLVIFLENGSTSWNGGQLGIVRPKGERFDRGMHAKKIGMLSSYKDLPHEFFRFFAKYYVLGIDSHD